MHSPVKNLLLSLLLTFPVTLAAAPIGYSINSDSGTGNADGLYEIDLANGSENRVGTVKALGQTLLDVEGLAFAPDGTLYGVDDESLTLFPLNPANGLSTANPVPITGLAGSSKNDFGMTFGCDGSLYITSIDRDAIYTMGLNGQVSFMGTLAGKRISALAAYGDKLYGLENGVNFAGGAITPKLYEISLNPFSVSAGVPVSHASLTKYYEAGLAFDATGKLWAITDRRNDGLKSQIMQINPATGAVIGGVQETASEQGFESLAISAPQGCQTPTDGVAKFAVRKLFTDGNEETPVTLNISCSGASVAPSSVTVQPYDGSQGILEHVFVAFNIAGDTTDCRVWESDVPGYDASYGCFSQTGCVTTENECVFDGAEKDSLSFCTIRNKPEPVEITVAVDWFFGAHVEDLDVDAWVGLVCSNAVDGDGEWFDGDMVWFWNFAPDSEPQEANVVPSFVNETECRTVVRDNRSALEWDGNCMDDVLVKPGDEDFTCLVELTLFFEGIPTMSRSGLLLIISLLMLTGLVAVRRI